MAVNTWYWKCLGPVGVIAITAVGGAARVRDRPRPRAQGQSPGAPCEAHRASTLLSVVGQRQETPGLPEPVERADDVLEMHWAWATWVLILPSGQSALKARQRWRY